MQHTPKRVDDRFTLIIEKLADFKPVYLFLCHSALLHLHGQRFCIQADQQLHELLRAWRPQGFTALLLFEFQLASYCSVLVMCINDEKHNSWFYPTQ